MTQLLNDFDDAAAEQLQRTRAQGVRRQIEDLLREWNDQKTDCLLLGYGMLEDQDGSGLNNKPEATF